MTVMYRPRGEINAAVRKAWHKAPHVKREQYIGMVTSRKRRVEAAGEREEFNQMHGIGDRAPKAVRIIRMAQNLPRRVKVTLPKVNLPE